MFAGDAAKAAATPLRWQVEGVGAFDQWLGEARARVIADRARELLARHMLSLAPPGTAP